MWDLPGPGLEPMSATLAGGFLTTAPPGKPPGYVLYLDCINCDMFLEFCKGVTVRETWLQGTQDVSALCFTTVNLQLSQN